MIEINKVSKSYVFDKDSSELVLKDMSLILKSGFNVLYGPSGCGKSTLLNVISGLDTDYNGEVLVGGKNLRSINLDDFHRDQVGFVFQSFNLISHLTVLQNILVAFSLDRSLTKREAKIKALELLKLVDLEDYDSKYPNQLSGGQKQRVAIARALVNDPSIIIADEPTGALDSKTSVEILKILKKLSTENRTIIVVTHDENVSKYADQIYRLADGCISESKVINEFENMDHDVKKVSGISKGALIKLAVSNFSNRLFRNVLVGIGSAIGIIGILLSLGLGNGIDNGVRGIFSSILSPTSITVTALKPGGVANFGPPSVEFSQQQIDEVEQILEEEAITEFYLDQYYNDVLVKYEEKDIKIEDLPYVATVQKLDYQPDRQSNYSVEDGTLLVGDVLSDESNEIYITKDLAAALLAIDKVDLDEVSAGKLLGKEIVLNFSVRDDLNVTSYDYETKIAGVLNSDTFSTLIYASNKAFEDVSVLTDSVGKVLSISAYANSSKQAQEISDKYADLEDYDLGTLGDALDQISTLTTAITITLAFVAGLSLIVAAVMIAIVLYIGVIERTREIGVLRALGYRGKDIRFLFLMEAILIIFISNFIAIVISYVIQISVNPIVTRSSGFKDPLAISPENMLFVFLVTLIIAIFAGLYPASKGAKLDPIECLRSE